MENKNQEKKPGLAGKLFGGIGLSLVIMGAFLLLQLVVIVAVMLAAAFAAAIVTRGDLEQMMRIMGGITADGGFLTRLTVIATAVSAVPAAFFYRLLWGRKKTTEDKRYFREKVLRARPIILVSVSAFGLYFVSIVLVAVIAAVSPETMEQYNEMMESTLGGSELLVMLAAVILAPINEECIMRGLILKNLQNYFSAPVAIALQAVLFGIFHMNWVQGIYVLPIGAALGYVAVKSRSVLPCIYMHLFYNLMSFVLGVLPEACQTAGFCLAAIVVSAVVVWGMKKNLTEPR